MYSSALKRSKLYCCFDKLGHPVRILVTCVGSTAGTLAVTKTRQGWVEQEIQHRCWACLPLSSSEGYLRLNTSARSYSLRIYPSLANRAVPIWVLTLFALPLPARRPLSPPLCTRHCAITFLTIRHGHA